jgi:hypothetical protein
MEYQHLTDKELLALWDIEDDPMKRQQLYVYATQYRNPPLFPTFHGVGGGDEDIEGQPFSNLIEKRYGLYPSLDDPRRHEKLFEKLEFSESRQESLRTLQERGVDLCDPSNEFELSPVQRFVSRFLSAGSPYNSALLYHGVGVGKTCAAISIAESYLEMFPRRKVIVVAPPNIQPNFRRTIFDIDNLKIASDENTPNTQKGCTGNFYLLRTGTEFEREKTVIASRVRGLIDMRYEFMGYIQFGRSIEKVRARGGQEAVRRMFEGRLILIDEAHNLRDVPGESEDDNIDSAGGDEEVEDSKAGKRLTPSLLEVLKVVHGTKLVLLTATPMYNNYREIIFLLNLLLLNDKRLRLKESDIFAPNGSFVPGGEEKLGNAAAAYISFMRGENPLSFPIRLKPAIASIENWPERNPKGDPVDSGIQVKNLPLVPVLFEGDSLNDYLKISEDAVRRGGVAVSSIDTMVQSGNWLYPGTEALESRIRDVGFDACFSETGGQFTSKQGPPKWLLAENLKSVSPKAAFIVKNLQTAKGVVFIYSRFIKSGALPLALALEANGYVPFGREPFLANGAQDGLGRVCAFCQKREKGHTGHTFKEATYILLTGKGSLSPNNSAMVAKARASSNRYGLEIKIIVGSQVASEGIDLRFVREIYVFDSWFHLNKMEQVLGRGVRTCSHALLEPEKRNTTIYLLVNRFPEDVEEETADLYMYRVAMKKAQQMGKVTRVLKRYALDCNLNLNAIVIPEGELDDQDHIDAQGREHLIEVHDSPFTAVCDWIETCDYTCAETVEKPEEPDISTYDEYSARWHESGLKRAIIQIFSKETPMFQFADLQKQPSLEHVPVPALKALLAEIVGNQAFRVRLGKQEGYIVHRNGYYLFQPDALIDPGIPLALRVQSFPVKRDVYEPPLEVVRKVEEVNKEIWGEIRKWADLIRAGTAPLDMPPGVVEGLQERYKSPSDLLKEQQHLYGVLWLYVSMKGNEVWRAALADALLGLVWDEMLQMKEQLKYCRTDVIGAEQYMKKGTRDVFRFVDTHTGLLKYLVPEGTPVDAAVAKVFDTDTTDPLNALVANTNTVGNMYGILVPNLKSGSLIFKIADKPSPPGKAPPKAAACEILTQISFHHESLVALGKVLVAAGLPNFGLTMEEMTGVRKFQNASRACSLKNVILRWMDLMGVPMGGVKRRWFYRPIASYKSKHQVLLEKVKKGRAKKGVVA